MISSFEEMNIIQKSVIFALILVSASCALLRARVEPYPSGLMFPVIEETRLAVEGKINGLVRGTGGALYFSTDKGKIIRLDPETRRILWEYATANPVHEPVLGAEGRVFAVDSAGVIYGLSPGGQLIWKNRPGGKISTRLAEIGGKVYFGLESGDFLCLRGENGEEAWTFKAGSAAVTEAAFWKDHAVFGSQDGKFHILGGGGKLESEIKTGLKLEGFIGVDGDRLFFGSDRNDICCLNLAGKKISWRMTTGGRLLSPPLMDKKRLYVLGSNNVLTCLEKRGGNILWWKIIPARTPFRLERSGDRILVSSLSPSIFCFDALSGRGLGTFAAGEDSTASPAPASTNPVWLDPLLLVGFYDEPADTARLLFLRKEVNARISPSSASPLKLGGEVTFMAEAAGFHRPRFEFFMRAGNQEEVVQKESEKGFWKWYPDKEGVYAIGVKVRDARQTVKAEIPIEVRKDD